LKFLRDSHRSIKSGKRAEVAERNFTSSVIGPYLISKRNI
jgi:hypothetical protein